MRSGTSSAELKVRGSEAMTKVAGASGIICRLSIVGVAKAGEIAAVRAFFLML
jgi:hypothetical protein